VGLKLLQQYFRHILKASSDYRAAVFINHYLLFFARNWLPTTTLETEVERILLELYKQKTFFSDHFMTAAP